MAWNAIQSLATASLARRPCRLPPTLHARELTLLQVPACNPSTKSRIKPSLPRSTNDNAVPTVVGGGLSRMRIPGVGLCLIWRSPWPGIRVPVVSTLNFLPRASLTTTATDKPKSIDAIRCTESTMMEPQQNKIGFHAGALAPAGLLPRWSVQRLATPLDARPPRQLQLAGG